MAHPKPTGPARPANPSIYGLCALGWLGDYTPDASTDRPARGSFGPNAWLVDDMYDRFLADPTSVAESWREFFADYQRSTLPAVANAAPVASTVEAKSVAIDAEASPLRGAAARIVTNMNASLAVPTATSVRTVPARLLEINRTALNEALARSSGAKVSFTHLIAYAIVMGLREVPALNSTFVEAVDEKGTPGVRHHEHVGLGLAVDVQKKDGSRNLLVPVIKDGDTMDFRAFLLVYEDLVRKSTAVRTARTISRGRRFRSRIRARSAPCSRCRD